MSRALICVLFLLAGGCGQNLANNGPLQRTVSGMHATARKSGREEPPPRIAPSPRVPALAIGGPAHDCCDETRQAIVVRGGEVPPLVARSNVDLYLGMQSVAGSDHSLTAELRTRFKKLGIGMHNTLFLERGTSLSVYGVDLLFRLFRSPQLELWASAGFAGASADPPLTSLGADVGLSAEHGLGGAVAVVGDARQFWLQDGVTATELSLGLRAAIFRATYRVTDFSVGPPLHGPEVGLAIAF